MTIRKLEWDSAFFGCTVAEVRLRMRDTMARDLSKKLASDHTLLYVFSPRRLRRLEKAGARLVDVKVTYEKNLPREIKEERKPSIPHGIYAYRGSLNRALVSLALESGRYSRFKIDPLLRGKFKSLYSLWIKNSLNRRFADEVFVAKEGKKSIGLVTLQQTKKSGKIGIMAVDSAERGKGVGSRLLTAADTWYRDKGLKKAIVVTQRANATACSFYEKNGYRVKSVEYVYHVWA